jgi:hypothetical protein
MPCSGTSGLNNDCQRQRLRVGVLIECDLLRYAIVGEKEIVSSELKDDFSSLGLHKDRNLN